MDNNNAVTFERNAQTRFFLCRSCHNHVLPGNNISAVSLPSAPGDTIRVLCLHPVNVRVEPSDALIFHFLPYVRTPSQSRVGFQTYPMITVDCDIHCNSCNTCLGRRSFLHHVAVPGLPHPIMPMSRWSILQLDQLLYWNGTQMVYADTHQPANPNNQ